MIQELDAQTTVVMAWFMRILGFDPPIEEVGPVSEEQKKEGLKAVVEGNRRMADVVKINLDILNEIFTKYLIDRELEGIQFNVSLCGMCNRNSYCRGIRQPWPRNGGRVPPLDAGDTASRLRHPGHGDGAGQGIVMAVRVT